MKKLKLRFRYAKPSDLDFVVRGMNEVEFVIEKVKPTKKKAVERRKQAATAIKNRKITIAEDEAGERVGFAWLETSGKTPFGVNYGKWNNEYAWVSWSFVGARWRGKGVGRALYAALEKIARKRGIREIMLDVFEVNTKSKKFHAKLGFKPLLTIYSKKLL